MNYFRQFLAVHTHNPTNAFARRLAREKLGKARETTSDPGVENPKD